MRKKIIHINQHVIKANLKSGARDPVITVKHGETNTYAHSVDICDKEGTVVARVLYRPDNPLSCGARVWIETYAELILDPRKPEAQPFVACPEAGKSHSGDCKAPNPEFTGVCEPIIEKWLS